MKTSLEQKDKYRKDFARSHRSQDHGTRGNTWARLDSGSISHGGKPSTGDREAISTEVSEWLNGLNDDDKQFVFQDQDDVPLDEHEGETYQTNPQQAVWDSEEIDSGASELPLHLRPEARQELATTLAARRRHLARAATLDPELANDGGHDYVDGFSIKRKDS